MSNSPVSQDGGEIAESELERVALQSGAVTCGISHDPQRKRGGYSRDEEYKGGSYTMYRSEVRNMRKSENKLLRMREWERNERKVSKAKEKQGYVYVIVQNLL